MKKKLTKKQRKAKERVQYESTPKKNNIQPYYPEDSEYEKYKEKDDNYGLQDIGSSEDLNVVDVFSKSPTYPNIGSNFEDDDFEEDDFDDYFEDKIQFATNPGRKSREIEKTSFDLQMFLDSMEFESEGDAQKHIGKLIKDYNARKVSVDESNLEPEEKAQMMMYDAFEARTKKER